jgi:hypothetical protein
MRPADDCKLDCQRRAPLHPAPIAQPRFCSTGYDAPHGSRRCGTLRVAAAVGSGALSASGSAVRLASGASSPRTALPAIGRAPRSQGHFSPSPRERRRLPRPETPSTDKRALTSPRATPRPLGRGIVPGALSPDPRRTRALPWSRAQPQPSTFASIRTPPAGICKQPEARARPGNVRTSRMPTPFPRGRAAPGGAASRRASGKD